MANHVAVLRVLQELGEITPQEHAAITHAIATCEQHAALVARLGELEKGWRENANQNAAMWEGETPPHSIALVASAAARTSDADDLARVVAGNGGDNE